MSHLTSTALATAPVQPSTGANEPIGVHSARLSHGFWGERQTLNTSASIGHAIAWMDRSGWTANFTNAATGRPFEHRGYQFADSEIYKIMEAIAWDIARGDASHRAELDHLIDIVLAAQEPDGYLHTLFGRSWQRPRYSDFSWGHELYCFGHFIQAAVAHHRATGEVRLLQAGIRLADHVCVMFGEGEMNRVCGHPEIEVALTELARETGDRRYLGQARVFVERRGSGTLPPHEFGPAYWQDDIAVTQASVLRGHAVRALYLAAGAVDIAVDDEDEPLLTALGKQWQNTVARRTYLTGGMGSHHMDEAFGDDFVLPPDRSYCETCAGVASVMFSWRMLLATGEAKYAELIERTLYNVVATSPSADGTAFFYANTLHQRVEHSEPSRNEDGVVIRGGAAGRQPWFEVSCCPPNVARTLASIGAYVVTENTEGIQVQQFVAGAFRTSQALIKIETDYPNHGEIVVRVQEASAPVRVSVRVPSWASGATGVLDHGGEPAESLEPGEYTAPIELAEGQQLTITVPLQVRTTYPDPRADAIRGTVAFERGPEVLALESHDLPTGWDINSIAVGDPQSVRESDGEVTVDLVHYPSGDAEWPYRASAALTPDPQSERVRLSRYHEWAERGPCTMRVWMPTSGV